MSDESVAVVEEEETNTEVESDANPLFDTLFEAAAEEIEDETRGRPTSLSSALHEIEHEDESPAEGEPEEVEETPPPAVEAPAATEASVPRKRIKRKRKVIDPDPEVPTVAPIRSTEDPFVSELNEDEKERYELSKWAEGNLQGYSGLSGQYLGFFKKHKEYIEKRLSEDPDVDLRDDRDYENFKNINRPKVGSREVSQMEEERRLSIAEYRAVQKLQPEIERLRREQHVMQEKPKVAEKFNRFKATKLKDAVPADLRQLHSELGSDFKNKHPFEHGIIDSVLSDALAMSESFLQIASGIKPFNEADPLHKRVSDWIDGEQTAFINGGKTVRNGKTFIRRERYSQLSESEREKYYIFTDEQLLDILALRAKQNMNGKVSHLRSQMESAGYTRGKTPARAIPPPAPQPTPKMHPSQSAGATVGADAVEEPKGKDPLTLLGL
jgi:hypothetical protein